MFSSSRHAPAKHPPRDFPIALELQYRVVRDPAEENRGMGRTMWISSREVIFETAEPLPVGTDLEMTVAWPAMLDSSVGMQLWVRAHVVHSSALVVTAAIHKYQFRTRSRAKAAGSADG